MPDGSLDLFGREGILTDLITECVGYPNRRARNRDLPVIVLLGPRASGKTERLERLESDHANKVPCARLDLGDEAYEDATGDSLPREVLIKLSFDLGEHRKHFGRLKFPRLTLGLLAVSSPVDLRARGRALLDIKRILDSDDSVKKVSEFLDELPEFVRQQQLVQVPITDPVLIIALRGLAPIVLRRLVLRKSLPWYGQRVPGGAENPYDALIRLNHMDRRGDEERRLVDETLFEAFLTDLYANFNEGLDHWDRVFNCLALLDNVDSRAGESFLNLLVTARHRRAQPMTSNCDPLVVVAARRHRHRPSDDGALRAVRPEDAGYHLWLAKPSRERASWLYLVELRDLTLEEVEQAVADAELPRIPKGFARFTHRLTAGHPGTVKLVIDSVKMELERNPSGLDLRWVLELPVPVDQLRPELSVGSRALDGLLAGMEASQRRDLVTCAGAQDIIAAGSLEALGVVGTGMVGELYEILQADLWVTATTARGQQQLVAHGLLRRLLLWELARRPQNAAGAHPHDSRDDRDPGWTAVHTWLRDYYRDPDDGIERLHHSLALGDLDVVVRFFDESFREGRIRQWLTELNAVTAAPNRLHAQPRLSHCSPPEQVQALCEHVASDNPHGQTIARLTAAKWILADPLTVPDQELVSLIIDELKYLEHFAGREFKILFDEGQRYRELMETWRL